MIHINVEIERKIRDRIKWQNDKMQEARKLYGDRSAQVYRLQGNIGALEWVLREAGVKV